MVTTKSNSMGIHDVIKHDPNGLVQRDIRHLEKVFKHKRYSPKMSDREIMYLEGQQSVIDYIVSNLVAK